MMNRAVNSIQIVGWSGSGKTLLAESLARLATERGRRVGFVKHTHHRLSVERGGDTERLLAAGAEIAILASDPPDGIRFTSSEAHAVQWTQLHDLITICATDLVLIEGFKTVALTPRVVVDDSADSELRGDVIVTNRGSSVAKPSFKPSEAAELLAFLDTIRRA